jgi:hypothetical protein
MEAFNLHIIRTAVDDRHGFTFGFAIADPEMVGLDWSPAFNGGQSVGIVQMLRYYPAVPVGYLLFVRDVPDGDVTVLDDAARIEREGRYECTAGELCAALSACDALAGGGTSVRNSIF